MPLITQKVEEKVLLKIKISKAIKSEMERYCKWAEIDDEGYFLSEAARRVFTRDKEWQKECKKVKKTEAETVA